MSALLRTALTVVFALALATAALAGVTERVSVSSNGQEGNHNSEAASISADGRFVAFVSYASNLVPGEADGAWHVFVRDGLVGTTERVSVSSSGEQGNLHSGYPSISADGRYVAFESDATNLVPEDTNEYADVFVRDRLAGTTERVSVSSSEERGNLYSGYPSISADGRYVAFESDATNLVPGDTKQCSDVFVRDTLAGTTKRVSVSSSEEQANDHSRSGSISAGGRYVAFHSRASNLVPGDTNGEGDVFVRDRLLGTTERVSVSSSGEQGDGSSYEAYISGDGRYVAFWSWASNLVPGDTNGQWDVFVRDRLVGSTERVSVSSSGEQGNGSSWPGSSSADWRYVAFGSWASNLVPGDTNGWTDVFVRDRLLGTTEHVSVSSSGVQGNGHSGYATRAFISGDRRYMAFDSEASNLVPGDTNGYSDIFVRDTWSLSDTKAQPDGAPATASACTVTGAFSGFFYIEDADRASGVKVAWPGTVVEGGRYRVDGRLDTDPDGERFIDASLVRRVDSLPVEPLGLTCPSLGGGDKAYDALTGAGQRGITGAFGLNNIGILIRTCGTVTQIGPDYLYIADGSRLTDGTTTGDEDNIGVRVICGPAGYKPGDFVVVTGISSCFQTPSGQIARRVLTRRAEDLRKVGG